MSKTLGKAALVVGVIAAVATGAALIIGPAAAAAAGLGTVAAVASTTATVLSVTAAVTAKSPQATGSQTAFAADPDAGIPLVIGRTGTAGNIVMRAGFDTRDKGDNDRQSFVTVLSIGPSAAIEGFTADRAPVGFDGGGRAIGGYAGFMWQTRQLGALSEPALSFGAGAGAPPAWTAAHRLSGKTATTWTLRFDTKAKQYQNGVPAPMWVVRGAICYDPRKDSTYPGGSGAHRMVDPADTAAYDAAVATWEWTENPFLIGLRFVHGVWQRATDDPASKWQRVLGMGAPIAGIDVASFVEGANVAQAHGWACGGVVYSGDDKWETLKKILAAGMGEPIATGAKIGCFVNGPKVSLGQIGIDDVVGDASVAATRPRRDRINTITPRFRTEANGWKLLPGAPISVAEHVATDRGKRSKVVDYHFIQDGPQAGTAVRYEIENAREFGPIVLPLKLYWMGYKPGDCVTATLPELGLDAQPILLLNRSLAPASGIVTMTARSETTGKHAFALGQVAIPPPTPGVTGAPVVPVPAADAWAITGVALVSGETRVPALIVTGAVDAQTADEVVFEYRPFLDGQPIDAGWSAAGIEAPTVARKEIVSVRGGTAYEVSVRNRARNVSSDRRILGPVATALATGLEGQPGKDAITVSLDPPAVLARVRADGSLADGQVNHFSAIRSDRATETTIWTLIDAAGVGGFSGTAADFVAAGPSQWQSSGPDNLTLTAAGLVSVMATYGGSSGKLLLRAYSTGAQAISTIQKVADGADAPLITLTSDKAFAKYDQAGVYTGGSITFTAVRQNIPGTRTAFAIYRSSDRFQLDADWSDGYASRSAEYYGGSGGDRLVIAAAHVAYLIAVHGSFSVVAYRDGYTVNHEIQIVKVKDGDPGISAPLVLTQWSIDGVSGWHTHFFGADRFYRQSNDGGLTWGGAIRGVGENGGTGEDPTIVFRWSKTVPATPARDSGNPPPGWTDGPAADPEDGSVLFLTKAIFLDAAQQDDWSAPQRISGKDGQDGGQIIWGSSAVTVTCYSTGETKPGQLPQGTTVSYVRGGVVLTGQLVLTVTSSTPAITADIDDTQKIVYVTGVGANGSITVVARISGTEVGRQTLPVTRIVDAVAPATPTSSSRGIGLFVSQSSYGGAISNPASLKVGTSGVVRINGYADLYAQQGTGNFAHFVSVGAKVVFRQKGATDWIDLLGEVVADAQSPREYRNGEYFDDDFVGGYSGFFTFNGSSTLSGEVEYEFAVSARKIGGSVSGMMDGNIQVETS